MIQALGFVTSEYQQLVAVAVVAAVMVARGGVKMCSQVSRKQHEGP